MSASHSARRHTTNERQPSDRQQGHEPNCKSRSRVLPGQKAQHHASEQGNEQSFGERIQKPPNRYLSNGLQLRPDHFAPLRSSISRRWSSSSVSMPWSSRMFKINCSWESLKKRPTKWRISERVASLRPTRGAYTWARPSLECLT